MAAAATDASAVTARPGTVALTQPDGLTVDVRLNGDENHNWISTPEGFTLVRDSEGFLSFAKSDKGQIKASDLRYTGPISVETARTNGFVEGLQPQVSRQRKAP